MAATDLLVEVGDPGSATTLSSPGYTSGSSTSINVASTSNWPSTGKAVIFAIDEAEVVDGEEVQVAGTYNEYEGTVASATSVSNVAWQRGSGDRNYSAGSLTRVYIPVSAERENRLVEWGSAEHSEADGTHSDITADSVTLNASGNIDVPSGASIRDGNDNELVTFSQTASAVNELTVKNAATGNGPEIQATGGDTNIDVELIPKGTGRVVAPLGATAADVATSQTTTSSSFTDLSTAGPAVTLDTGTMALVSVSCTASNNFGGANRISYMGFAVSGASTVAASDTYAASILHASNSTSTMSATFLVTGLTAGSNTFTAKYRATGDTSTFASRRISVVPVN